ncbi:glycosyltransferase [Curtobacterium flaccumfaciens]|nr:glycosyltransferase [Curtobacterium flaccumfaciens]
MDGFIGLHETYVGDWAVAAPRSLRARLYRALDLVARRAADCYLIDTEQRADEVRRDATTPVLALEVGAPAWARPSKTARELDRQDDPLRVLYYGNYIPLHGIDSVIDALAAVRGRRAVTATCLGDGAARPAVERRVQALGLDDVVTFTGPVAERDLARVIHDHDIVLGVFGTSSKAGGVVANKVWQGLACGRTVITRDAAALNPIADTVGSALIRVPAGDPRALADAIVASCASRSTNDHDDVASRLEALVQRSFVAFGDWLLRTEPTQTGTTR